MSVKLNLRNGFSILELLAVIAIIVVVSAVLMPVIVSARKYADKGTDINNLHQLGLAAELYSQTSERIASSPLDFRGQETWSSPIWSSPYDPSRPGFRNNFLQGLGHTEPHYTEQIAPFKISYITFGDLFHTHGDKDLESVRRRANAGWLVSFGDSVSEEYTTSSGIFLKSYTRLCFDTSTHFYGPHSVDTPLHLSWLFCDPTEGEKLEDLK